MLWADLKDMPTLTIDGQEITVDPGTTVIQAAEQLIHVCEYQMGDNRSAYLAWTLDELRDSLGDELPKAAEEAFGDEPTAVLVSSNGRDLEFRALPGEKWSPEFCRAIIDDLTACDWGDCNVTVE